MPDWSRFCIYCQREFKTRAGFEKHINTKHIGTYAHRSLQEGRI